MIRKFFTFNVFLLVMTLMVTGQLMGYASYDQLAEYYAPVIYQEIFTDPSYAVFDRITSVDFDNNIDPTDNIQNAQNSNGELPAAIYYNVIESETHFFIYYFVYHTWTNEGGLTPYSNEFDGIMVVVYKDGSTYGNFTALEVMSNNRVSVFMERTSSEIESGSLTIGGYLKFYDDSYSQALNSVESGQGMHPILFARYAANGMGHYLRNWDTGIETESLRMLTYYFDSAATNYDAPAVGNETIDNANLGGDISNLHPVPYQLIPMTDSQRGIWALQWNSQFCNDSDRSNYYGYILGWPGNYCKKMKGATYTINGEATILQSEVMPWFFDDYGDSSSVLAGDWFFDPTRSFNAHVIINQNYSFNYSPFHPLIINNGMHLDPNSPSITSYPPRSVTLGNTYIYDVEARGNGTLYYSLVYAPDGMSIDSNSGYIQWHPSATGLYHVIVSVDDGSSFMLQHFTVNVVAPPPPGAHSGGGGGCEMAKSGNGIIPGFILMLLLPLFFKQLYPSRKRG